MSPTPSVDLLLSQNVCARWLVTGAAGFIGSHLVETLLAAGQSVVGVDNFSNGNPANLTEVRSQVGAEAWRRFQFIQADLTDYSVTEKAMADCQYVLHTAALGSIPRSVANPRLSIENNVTSFLNIADCARLFGNIRVVYSSSSSIYGDDPTLPKIESRVGRPLSPYAMSKRMNEETAEIFKRTYDASLVGLRYFNVFGPRQRRDGPYAAVIAKWIGQILSSEQTMIFGDGLSFRDFCPVANVVHANLLAALAPHSEVSGEIFNIALGNRVTLLELHRMITNAFRELGLVSSPRAPTFGANRVGDMKQSQADISKAQQKLGYRPLVQVEEGVLNTVKWFALRERAASMMASPTI